MSTTLVRPAIHIGEKLLDIPDQRQSAYDELFPVWKIRYLALPSLGYVRLSLSIYFILVR